VKEKILPQEEQDTDSRVSVGLTHSPLQGAETAWKGPAWGRSCLDYAATKRKCFLGRFGFFLVVIKTRILGLLLPRSYWFCFH